MRGVDPSQYRLIAVRPALQKLNLWSEAAENLVWGTAIHETGLRELHQLGGGPADGFLQVEPATHADLYKNTLAYHEDLKQRLITMLAPWPSAEDQLSTNLLYEAAVCRLLYWRAPTPLPAADDVRGLAQYWKAHYNTAQGAGDVDTWVHEYQQAGG